MACHDRIIPNLAMVVIQKFGVPDTVTQMNSTTLMHAEYRFRTELGLAKTVICHHPDAPIYGYWGEHAVCQTTGYRES